MEVRVKVTTKARKDVLTEIKPNTFTAEVKEKPEQNMANKKVILLLAEYFSVDEAQIRLITGHHVPSKTFSIMVK